MDNEQQEELRRLVQLHGNYQRNQQWAKSGPYQTQLSPEQEQQFAGWIQQNKIPFDPQDQMPDYDMRGYYQAQQNGDPSAKQAGNMHFPDTYKTPYHESFSNESMYANPNAPTWKDDRFLIDEKGNVLFDATQHR